MKKTQEINLKYPVLKLCGFAGWFAFLQAASVIFAIIGYFIWPHSFTDAKQVFEGVHQDPLNYFMKLDPFVLFGIILQFPVWLGLWAALRQIDEAKSAVALTLGLLSTVAILTTRPIIELYSLSSMYYSTNALDVKNIYLAAGQSLLSHFHGVAWAVSIITGGLSAILFALIMKKTKLFHIATFWTMLLSGLGAQIVLVPVIGIISLFFLGTIVGLIGTILCGVDLIKLDKKIKSMNGK
jgi:hypothetical protein